jgi:hypothetical protein
VYAARLRRGVLSLDLPVHDRLTDPLMARVIRWYKGRIKEDRSVTGPRNMPRDPPARKGEGGVSGNTFLLMVILIMILLFCLISLGPLIFF